jgi:hypothetical protein
MTAVLDRPTEKAAAKPAGLELLRVPFPPEKIGKLPRGKTELDYVGHADVTERLLDADPNWNWEPMGYAADGLPAMVTAANGQPIGLWIKLTVCGLTRIGFGSVSPGAFDAEKQLIGDAIRNAAMRFGVALDLWRKEPPHVDVAAGITPARVVAPSTPAASSNGRPKVLSREPVIDATTDRVRNCPDCGTGALELVTWDNHQSAICCSNWRTEDGGCKHRESVPDQTGIPF